jgi:hypothetical protein
MQAETDIEARDPREKERIRTDVCSGAWDGELGSARERHVRSGTETDRGEQKAE